MDVEAKNVGEIGRHNECSFLDVIVISKNLWDFSVHSFWKILREPHIKLPKSINISQADCTLKCCISDNSMNT